MNLRALSKDKKTYIVAILMAFLEFGSIAFPETITPKLEESVMGILIALGLVTARAAIKKAENAANGGSK